jgi:hypothetical protein
LTVNEPNLSHKNPPKNDWHFLGELELIVGTDSIENIYAQMKIILKPLNLHPDFQNKVLISAQDVVMRSQPSEVAINLAQIHIIVFVPTDYTASRGTWAFSMLKRSVFQLKVLLPLAVRLSSTCTWKDNQNSSDPVG